MTQFTLGDDRISLQLLQKSQISQFFGWLEQIGIIYSHTPMATYVNLRTFLNTVHGMNSQEKKIYFLFTYKNLYKCLKGRFVSHIIIAISNCNHCATLDKRLEYIPSSLLIFVGQKAFCSAIRRFSARLFSNKSRSRIAFTILFAKTSA